MKVYGQLEKAQLENLTSDPSALVAGLMWYRTDQKLFKVYDGTVVQTFVDLNTAQTLSNKILASPELTGAITFNQTTTPTTPAAGKNKFYYKTDGLLYTLDSAGNEALVGSGAEGGGATNLISNGSAESTAVSIFTPYADAAGTRPVDGIGGSPTVTTGINTTNVLVKNKDFTLVKPASNCQGQGWAISNIALPLAYRGKSVKAFLDFLVASGTFVPGTNGSSPTDGDLIAYFYDQTNSKLMEPSNIKFLGSSTTISDKYEGTVQFDINCTQVRMILHIASTSAVAWTLQVDNIALSPQNYAYGTPVTDWQPYTPTISGAGTPTAVNFVWRRVGDSLQVLGSFISGTPTAATAEFSMPAGLTANGSVISTYTYYGDWIRVVSTGSTRKRGKLIVGAGSNNIGLVSDDYTTALGPASALAANTAFSTSDSVKISAFNIPILGWSSSVQISDGYDGRVITAKGTLALSTFSTTTGVAVKIPWDTYPIDDVGGWSSGSYTVKSAGKYKIYGRISSAVTAGTGEIVAYLFKNNVNIEVSTNTKSGTASQPAACNFDFLVDLKVGDVIDLQVFQNIQATLTLRGNNVVFGISCINIEKITGAAAISASEKIRASYSQSSGQSIPTATFTTIISNNKDWDTHGVYNTSTGEFTFPRAGIATLKMNALYASSAAAAAMIFGIYKNGTLIREIGRYNKPATNMNAGPYPSSIDVDGIQGDKITIRAYQDTGGALSLFPSNAYNTIQFSMD